jgi:CheY-like chemotaxis protein
MYSDEQGCERRRITYHGRILLVSAVESDRDLYGDYLREEGFCVMDMNSAREAYTIASTVRLAAVVTEVRLCGDDDGLTLTRRLKQHPPLRRLPVLILSDSGFGSVREAARSAGCDCFLLKPCSRGTFTASLSTATTNAYRGSSFL